MALSGFSQESALLTGMPGSFKHTNNSQPTSTFVGCSWHSESPSAFLNSGCQGYEFLNPSHHQQFCLHENQISSKEASRPCQTWQDQVLPGLFLLRSSKQGPALPGVSSSAKLFYQPEHPFFCNPSHLSDLEAGAGYQGSAEEEPFGLFQNLSLLRIYWE